MMIEEFLGISIEDWVEIRSLIDCFFMGDVRRFIDFYGTNTLKIDGMSKEIYALERELEECKLPWIEPVMMWNRTCGTFNFTGHRCRGVSEFLLLRAEWCLNCKCYDPK